MACAPRSARRESEKESRALTWRRFAPDAPLVPVDDPVDDGQADSGAGKLGRVQPLEGLEQLARVGGIEPDAVVTDEVGQLLARLGAAELDPRLRLSAGELPGVAEQV